MFMVVSPRLFGQLLELAGHYLHRVVDDDVDAAELRDGRVDQTRDVGRLGDVRDDADAFLTVLGCVNAGRLAGCGIDVVDDDAGPLFGVGEHDVAADPPAAAGDDRNPVFQTHG
jgi:hypothetical protein